jgi:hypothetical protein
MLVVMQPAASAADIERVCEEITRQGFKPLPLPGEVRMAIGLLGDDSKADWSYIEALPGGQCAHRAEAVSAGLARVEARKHHRRDRPGRALWRQRDRAIVAGPARWKAKSRSSPSARAVRAAGATALRGGAFKPRSSPYAFQGLGQEGARAARARASRERARHRDRSDGRTRRRHGRGVRRLHPDRRAQHAELFAAAHVGRSASPCCSSAAWPPRSTTCC